jgi:NAD(P)-dependent dehydrogenase (short-subunit alcohol dehydrogenase family)
MPGAQQMERVALVTGAAGGIGSAIAAALAGQGWRLVLADRDGAALETVARSLTAQAADVATLAVDVTDEEAVAGAVRQAMHRYGRLDGCVSNAGTAGLVRPVEEYPLEVFEHTLAVNVTGTFLCLKYALPALRASGGGSFVAIGSTSSVRGRANLAGYVASKHAVLGLMRCAALEQVGSTVRVNAVLPGPTQTAMIDSINAMAAEREGGAIRRAVAAPLGQPQDVAGTVAFLLSDAARHMNGAALVVDGGSILA